MEHDGFLMVVLSIFAMVFLVSLWCCCYCVTKFKSAGRFEPTYTTDLPTVELGAHEAVHDATGTRNRTYTSHRPKEGIISRSVPRIITVSPRPLAGRVFTVAPNASYVSPYRPICTVASIDPAGQENFNDAPPPYSLLFSQQPHRPVPCMSMARF